MRALEARIYGLEITEERLVMAALDEGLEVHRRPDASPWAVLYTTVEEEAWPRRRNELPLAWLAGPGPPTAQVAAITAQHSRPVSSAGAAGSGVLPRGIPLRATCAGADQSEVSATTPTARGPVSFLGRGGQSRRS